MTLVPLEPAKTGLDQAFGPNRAAIIVVATLGHARTTASRTVNAAGETT
jgi:hypothetical protein